jgi:hypothetical protein
VSDDESKLSLDRNLIALNEGYEVKYWTKKLGADEVALRNAVQAVGPRAR